MLERAVGCIEPGSLRRLLPRSQRPLKSRRLLHSGFWNHGAAELEYSHLWAALMRDREIIVNEHGDVSTQFVANSSTGSFLDFLYPSGALRLLRHYSLWNSDIKDVQRPRLRFSRFGQRLYTSIATEASNLLAEGATESSIVKSKEQVSQTPVICEPFIDVEYPRLEHSSLSDVQHSPTAKNYNNIWEQFTTMHVRDRRPYLSPLLTSLSISHRSLDAERAASAFEDVRSIAAYSDYQSLIKLYLNCGMLQDAIELSREGSAKFNISVGSDLIIAHALDRCQWSLACEVWIQSKSLTQLWTSLRSNKPSVLDELHNLPDRALGLAEFVKEGLDESQDIEGTPNASALATILAAKALLFVSRETTLEKSKFHALIEVLQYWDADTKQLYESIIETLLGSGHTKVALQCYRRYRQRTTENISSHILRNVLEVACKHHNALGMQQVLDDWFRFYSEAPAHAYRQCMSAFAAQGDVNTVKLLFQKYIQTHGGKEMIRSADEIAPLLVVHSRRGELSQVIEIFNNMEAKYGVQPSILCWNILINAYGRVLDMDGAFAQYQRLLASSVQPDEYTYGTLMGICTTRGDLDQAMEVYQTAESHGVAPTPAMLDCLVLGHIKNNNLLQAEKICADALAMDFKGPLTRMWNYLLAEYAMRGDLENTNRIFRCMHEAGIDYNGATYAALMQVLAMVRQPNRAKKVLDVMRAAGVTITSFHYAIIMGGYIATGELQKVFHINNQMLRSDKKHTISTRLLTLKASIQEDQRRLESGSQEEQRTLAGKYFYDALAEPDEQEGADTMRKGIGYEPLDTAYLNSYFSYLIFVSAKLNDTYQATQIYEQYLQRLPEHRRHDRSLKILSALMLVNIRNHHWDSVQQLWDFSFEKAKRQGQSRRVPELGEVHKILPSHKLALSIHLNIQMRSLASQKKANELIRLKEMVEEAGFDLDNKNWNTYIQCLLRVRKEQSAFDYCELILMRGWTGWARLEQWNAPRRTRNQSAFSLRRLRRGKDHGPLRPFRATLLLLGKAYMDVQAIAIDFDDGRELQRHIESQCRMTLYALETMERKDDDLERETIG